MNKFKTWWRIQMRMAVIHLAEIYVIIEWPVRLLVNWLIFFTLWAWVGFAYMVMMLVRAWRIKKSGERSALVGKIWFWEQYNLY